MNSNKRKSGGAYRRKKQMVSLLAKAGKDRSKSKKQVTPGREIEIQVKMRGTENAKQN